MSSVAESTEGGDANGAMGKGSATIRGEKQVTYSMRWTILSIWALEFDLPPQHDKRCLRAATPGFVQYSAACLMLGYDCSFNMLTTKARLVHDCRGFGTG